MNYLNQIRFPIARILTNVTPSKSMQVTLNWGQNRNRVSLTHTFFDALPTSGCPGDPAAGAVIVGIMGGTVHERC